MKNNLYKILLFIFTIFIISSISLFILGKFNRIGYLSEFNLESSNNEEYIYNFRLKYYSKIFRNSDIYEVYLDSDSIIKENNFIKNITMQENGSPFGTLVSSKQLIYEEKIYNINYTLKIKLTFTILFFICLIAAIIYIKYNNYIYRIVKNFIFNKKKIILISYSVVFFILITVFLFIIPNISYKGSLSDFQLIAESKAGFVYKAKFEPISSLKLDTNRTLLLKNKPDYVKKYGYTMEINEIANLYNAYVGAICWNNEDGTFTVSNSTSYNIYTNYIIPLHIGEKYRVSVKAKRINGEGGNIRFTLDAANEAIYIDNTYNIGKEYNIYSKDIIIEHTLFNNYYPHVKYLTFYFPNGEINIESIKVEEISGKLYLKNGNEIIVTTTKNIDDNPYVGDIKYYSNINNNIFIKIIIILSIIYLILFIVLFENENKLVLVSASLIIIIQIFIYLSLYNYFRVIIS